MKNHILSTLIIFLLAFSFGCKKDSDIEIIPENTPFKINGYVQKGPFITGTKIIISELDTKLLQTGNTYYTQITSNTGNFEVDINSLVSDYVNLIAEGFYFNEISGKQSKSQITLYSLSDISISKSININVLSHLEKPRTEQLISEGLPFSSAKKQAQAEVLKIFNIYNDTLPPAEYLDISKSGDENAILLAVSLILQGFRNEADFTELLSNISLDIKDNGVLDNQSLGSQLINHAIYLDSLSIRSNLQNRYLDLGLTTEIPKFDIYLKNFIENTSYAIDESLITYPATGYYGPNILYYANTHFNSNNKYSIAANLSSVASLRIKLTYISGGFGWLVFSEQNWDLQYPYLVAENPGEYCDFSVIIDSGSEILIEYYEMGSSVPSITKTIFAY